MLLLKLKFTLGEEEKDILNNQDSKEEFNMLQLQNKLNNMHKECLVRLLSHLRLVQ
jgi:hypothetical protein